MTASGGPKDCRSLINPQISFRGKSTCISSSLWKSLLPRLHCKIWFRRSAEAASLLISTPYRSKTDLLSKLPKRLKGYGNFLPPDWRIVVLVDEDREDCVSLKEKLDQAASDAGLVTKSMAQKGSRFQVLNRIAMEELEAWFFGDVQAIHQAYETSLSVSCNEIRLQRSGCDQRRNLGGHGT